MGWFTSKPKNNAPKSGAHGNSRWGSVDDLNKIGAFTKDAGLPVGFLNGQQFYHPARRKPHGLVLGGTGTGKTTRIFAPIYLSDAASKMSFVTVDTARDISAIGLPHRSTLGPSHLVDPADMMRGLDLGTTKPACYSPTADFLKVNDRLRFASRAERLTTMNVGMPSGDGHYFYTMARRAVQGATMGMAAHAPKNCNLPAIAKLFNGDFFSWVRWLLREPGIDPFIFDLLRPFLFKEGKEHEVKSVPDVINTICAEMKWIFNAAISESLHHSDFSFARLAHEVGTVTLCAPLDLLADGFDRWLSMILGCALTELQETPGPVPVVFILDELAQYCSEEVSKIVSRIYATGRKYNLRVYCAATSVGQLEKDCFQHGRHQDVLGNSGVIHVLNVSDPESSRFVKELSGEKTEIDVSWSYNSGTGSGSSRSVSRSQRGAPVIRQEQCRAIEDDSQAVLLDGCPHLIYAQTKSYQDVPHLAKRAGQNPFWKKQQAAKAKAKPRKKVDEVAILTKIWR